MQKDENEISPDLLAKMADALDGVPFYPEKVEEVPPEEAPPTVWERKLRTFNRAERRRMQRQSYKPLHVPPKLQTPSGLHRLPPAHDAVVNAVTRGNVSYEYLAQRQGLTKTAVRLSVRAGLKRAREMTL